MVRSLYANAKTPQNAWPFSCRRNIHFADENLLYSIVVLAGFFLIVFALLLLLLALLSLELFM